MAMGGAAGDEGSDSATEDKFDSNFGNIGSSDGREIDKTPDFPDDGFDNDSVWGGGQDDFSVSVYHSTAPVKNQTSKAIPISKISIGKKSRKKSTPSSFRTKTKNSSVSEQAQSKVTRRPMESQSSNPGGFEIISSTPTKTHQRDSSSRRERSSGGGNERSSRSQRSRSFRGLKEEHRSNSESKMLDETPQKSNDRRSKSSRRLVDSDNNIETELLRGRRLREDSTSEEERMSMSCGNLNELEFGMIENFNRSLGALSSFELSNEEPTSKRRGRRRRSFEGKSEIEGRPSLGGFPLAAVSKENKRSSAPDRSPPTPISTLASSTTTTTHGGERSSRKERTSMNPRERSLSPNSIIKVPSKSSASNDDHGGRGKSPGRLSRRNGRSKSPGKYAGHRSGRSKSPGKYAGRRSGRSKSPGTLSRQGQKERGKSPRTQGRRNKDRTRNIRRTKSDDLDSLSRSIADLEDIGIFVDMEPTNETTKENEDNDKGDDSAPRMRRLPSRTKSMDSRPRPKLVDETQRLSEHEHTTRRRAGTRPGSHTSEKSSERSSHRSADRSIDPNSIDSKRTHMRRRNSSRKQNSLTSGLAFVDSEPGSAKKTKTRGDSKSVGLDFGTRRTLQDLQSSVKRAMSKREEYTSKRSHSDRELDDSRKESDHKPSGNESTDQKSSEHRSSASSGGGNSSSDKGRQEEKRKERIALAKERRREEEARLKILKEEARVLEEKRLAEEARLSLLKEETKLLEEKRKDEESRLKAEAELAKEQRLAEESKLRDQLELLREQRLAEEARIARIREEARFEKQRRSTEESKLKEAIANEQRLALEARQTRLHEEAILEESKDEYRVSPRRVQSEVHQNTMSNTSVVQPKRSTSMDLPDT